MTVRTWKIVALLAIAALAAWADYKHPLGVRVIRNHANATPPGPVAAD